MKFIGRRLSSDTSKFGKLRELIVTKKFTQDEVDAFTKLTGDENPIHSVRVPLEQRKVNGAFLNAIVAGIIGSRLPGPGTVVLEQKFSFPSACRVEVDIKIIVRLVKERKISVVEYECVQNDDIVFRGEAKLLTKAKC